VLVPTIAAKANPANVFDSFIVSSKKIHDRALQP